MIELLKALDKLPGYKIADSHFRIGSKIHISDFYYAKRFFQNSFFASRFAYLLSRHIIRDLGEEKLAELRQQGLTLVGYGIYSELLLSLTEKFLRKLASFTDDKINHNHITDADALELVKAKHPYSSVVLIVPISSTFTTSIKAEELLKQKYTCKVLSPHYNILTVSSSYSEKENRDIEEEFGWINKDIPNKTIFVNAFFETEVGSVKAQKYFLRLPSVWKKIEKCSDCFPQLMTGGTESQEKPLFETDRTSVTPNIIFAYPKSIGVDETTSVYDFELTPAMVEYGHHRRNHNHFLYSIDTEAFLLRNFPQVKKWLEELKGKKVFTDQFKESQNILIVSSCHYSNASFINLVNEVLFASSANIIHYDPSNDYIQNFDMIYGQEVYMADKILFVDDSLKSGATFHKIDEFVRHTLSSRNTKNNLEARRHRIDACLFLLNKSQPFTYNTIRETISDQRNVYAFATIHLYTALSYDEISPLILEQRKYQQLMDEALLDSLKMHFQGQRSKLNTKNRKLAQDKMSEERHLLMLEATHKLYQYFSSEEAFFDGTFNAFVTDLQAKTRIPNTYKYENDSAGSGLGLFESCLLKVLTQPPFTQYEPVRKMVFQWMLDLLISHIDVISTKITEKKFTYENYQQLKFLMRRAGLLNANILISPVFFQLLHKLYEPGGIPLLISQAREDIVTYKEKNVQTAVAVLQEKIRSLEEFGIFYAAQVKELLLLNEGKFVYLSQQLSTLSIKDNMGLQRLRTLIFIENAWLVHRFFEFVSRQSDWQGLHVEKEDAVGEAIVQLLKSPRIKNHQKYRTLSGYLASTSPKAPEENSLLVTYLTIKEWMTRELQEKATLSEKTRDLFLRLNQLVKFADDTDKNVSMIGSFLIVRDKQGMAYLIYDKNNEGEGELDPYEWDNANNRLLTQLLEGKNSGDLPYYETVLELERPTGQQGWRELHAVEQNRYVELSNEFLDRKLNRLILMRLTRIENGVEKCRGLVGFYFRIQVQQDTDLTRLQYLLLLRQDITDFVEKNHQNNLFNEWLIAENTKRLVLLAGHGKEMMQNLITKLPEYSQIVINQEHLQNIVLLSSNLTLAGAEDQIKEKFHHFYNVGNTKEITQDYLRDLKEMTDKIYNTPSVENSVYCDVVWESPEEPFQFAFNRNILDLICLELIINAKKNRWHFVEGNEVDGFEHNEVRLSMKVMPGTPRKLHLSIANTGPNIEIGGDPNTLANLNSKSRNVKHDYTTSGTALIKILIRKILDSEIQFTSKKLDKNDELHEFTVLVILKEMSEYENT